MILKKAVQMADIVAFTLQKSLPCTCHCSRDHSGGSVRK